MKGAMIALVLALGIAVACAPRLALPPPPALPAARLAVPPPPLPPPSATAPAVRIDPPADAGQAPIPSAPIDERAARLAWLEGEVARAQAEQRAAERAARLARIEASEAPARAVAVWATWGGLLLAVLGLGAAVALRVMGIPVGGRTAAAAAAGGAVVFVVGRVAVEVLGAGWWPWIVAGLAVAAVVAVVAVLVSARRWTAAHWHAWDFGRKAADALGRIDRRALDDLNAASLEGQHRAGVLHLNDRILARLFPT